MIMLFSISGSSLLGLFAGSYAIACLISNFRSRVTHFKIPKKIIFSCTPTERNSKSRDRLRPDQTDNQAVIEGFGCQSLYRFGHLLISFILLFVRKHIFAWRANQWPTIDDDIDVAFVPPSNSLILVSDFWRALWSWHFALHRPSTLPCALLLEL